MILIIGLGNPGKKFNSTRHNIGFQTLDFFAEKNNFPDFEMVKKYNAMVSENENILLAKPQTFMNESGKSVKEILRNNPLENLIVIHDDIDLPIGKIKISAASGSGGHKGVESIIQNLGNKDFIRLRIGIYPENGKPKAVEKFVLKKFTADEQKVLNDIIEKSAQSLNYFIENGLEKTMNQFN